MRDNRRQSLATESEEERAVRLQQMREGWPLRLKRRKQQATADECQPTSQVGHWNWRRESSQATADEGQAGLWDWRRESYSGWGTGWPLRLKKSEQPGYSRWVPTNITGWLLRLAVKERPDYSVTGKGKENNSHSCLCLNSSLFRLRCGSFCTRLRIHCLRAHACPHNALHSPSIYTMGFYWSYTLLL